MIRHGLELEVWSSRFATRLCAAQPDVDRPLALQLASALQGVLGILRPEDAADTFLANRLDLFKATEAAACDALRSASEK